MLRIVWIWLFVGFLGHATGAFAAIQVDACTECCPDDGPDEQHCPPTCTDCVCSIPTAIEVPSISVVRPRWRVVEVTPEDPPAFALTPPPSPDPRELLHVPR